MKKTLLVDAQFLLKYSFHGDKQTFTSFGYIGAIKTFYSIIRRMIKEFEATKVILFWDGINSGRLRYDVYPLYKGNRDKEFYGTDLILSDKDIEREETSEKSLLKQRARIQQYAEELYIRQVEHPFVEADDCIGYYASELREEDEECIIYTNDRDMCICIDDHVSVYLANKKSLVTKYTYTMFYFDHHYKNASLVKAILGCTTDVIFGVDGLGEKGLMKHFPEIRHMEISFDFIYDKAVEINKGRKKPLVALQNLIDGKTSVHIQNEKEDKFNEEHGLPPRSKNLFDTILTGKHLYELNEKLVNIKKPNFISDDCIELIEEQCFTPLSDENRGGVFLQRLMQEDGLINEIHGGAEGYRNFLIEFLPVVKTEKDLFQKHLKENQ